MALAVVGSDAQRVSRIVSHLVRSTGRGMCTSGYRVEEEGSDTKESK